MRVILSHRQLDFDALASMFGAYKLYPNSIMILDGKPIPYVQEFISLAKDLLPFKDVKDINPQEVTHIILVDTHNINRTSTVVKKIMENPNVKLEIYDHHPYSGSLKQGITIESVGACVTLLVERIMAKGIPVNSFEATLLALGIYDDTGSLLFDNTTARDAQAVAFLLGQGAQLNIIAEYLRRPLTEQQKELLQELVDRGQVYNVQGTSFYIATAESKDYIGGLALLAHRIGELEGAEIWFLVVKMDQRVYITGRSRHEELAINKIVEHFGGAGHPKAASASIKNGDLEEIVAELKAEISKHINSPLLVRDIMSRIVHSVSPNTKLSEVQQLLLRYGHTGLPVIDDGVLVGIISRRDVDKALKHGLGHAPVKGFMSTDVITLDADAPWEQAQRLMVENDIGRLPIVANGHVTGIVSRSDILRLVHGGAVPIGTELARARSLANREEILNLIDNLPQEIKRLLLASRQVCQQLRCKAYVVGGFVRDLLLKMPTQDLDLVVEGEKSTFFAKALIEVLGEGELLGHPRFGTARISFSDGTHLDVAATRWEFYAYPGALPEVEESCLREDLFRRDFTINAMAIALDHEHYGELIDYYGGLRDIKQGQIQFLHRLSFIDDPTRIFRAIRFAARYGFSIAHETTKGIGIALKEGVLKNLSQERLTEELYLILHEERYLDMITMLSQMGIFKNWFGTEYPWNVEKPHIHPNSNALHQRWLYLIKDMDDQAIKLITERLTLTKDMRKLTLHYLELRAALRQMQGDFSWSRLDVLLETEPLWLIELLMQDQALTVPLLNYVNRVKQINSKFSGRTLIDLGIPEGPIIGELIRSIRQAWLDGTINTPEEEEQYVNAQIKSIMNGGAECLI